MIVGLIPARINSFRLPRKPLLKIDKIPIVIHTMKRAMLCKKIDKIYVCTDSEEIAKVVEEYSGNFILTKSTHNNGTERIAEAAKKIGRVSKIIDIQCDEVLLNPKNLSLLIDFHSKNNKFDIVVPHSLLKKKTDRNVVKIVSNKDHKILYMSRENIPFSNIAITLKRHLDIISFKPNILKKFSNLKKSLNERIEGIELLRAIDNNFSVGTFQIKTDTFSVNTKTDYINAIEFMKNCPLRKKYS